MFVFSIVKYYITTIATKWYSQPAYATNCFQILSTYYIHIVYFSGAGGTSQASNVTSQAKESLQKKNATLPSADQDQDQDTGEFTVYIYIYIYIYISLNTYNSRD